VKKLTIGFGILMGLILAAIIIIPLVVDVDQYRPKIVDAVNQKINGKLTLGHLTLKLWGRIQINVAGMELVDSRGHKVVGVKDAFFHLPYTSILGGSPSLTLRMDSPEIHVVKEANGKMNVMGLMKEGALDKEAAPSPTGSAAPAEKSGKTTLPSIVTNARIGIDLRNALLNYHDEVAHSNTTTKNLNFRVKDLSLSRKTDIEISGLFESAQEDALKVAGPFKVDASLDPHLAGGKLHGLGMELNADFSDLEIQVGTAFHKAKGVAAKINGKMDSIDDGMKIEKFVAQFFNAEISAQGLVKALSSDKPDVDVSVT
jgi:AsmA protein